MSNAEVAEAIPNGYRMGKPKSTNCPDELYELMCQCWHSDPPKRPTFEFLAAHLLTYTISSEMVYDGNEDY